MFISDTSRIIHQKGNPKTKSLKAESIQQQIKANNKKQFQLKGENQSLNLKDSYPHQVSKHQFHVTNNLNITQRHTESKASKLGKKQILKLGKDKEKNPKNTSIQKKSMYATPKSPYIERTSKNSVSIKNKYSFQKIPHRTTASKTSKSTIQLTKSRGNDKKKSGLKKNFSRERIDVSEFEGSSSKEEKYKEKVQKIENSMNLLWEYVKQLSENNRINLYVTLACIQKSQKNDEKIKKVQEQLHIQENKINSLKFELKVLENKHNRD